MHGSVNLVGREMYLWVISMNMCDRKTNYVVFARQRAKVDMFLFMAAVLTFSLPEQASSEYHENV
jgi:hypothetical protein